MSKTVATRAELVGKAEEVFWGLWASVFYARPTSPRSVLVCSTNHREGASLVAGAMAVAGGSAAAALVPIGRTTGGEEGDEIGDLENLAADREDAQGGEAGAPAEVTQESPPAAGGVLLIDFNLRTPALHRLFGLPPAPGLAEVLLGRSDLASAVHRVGPGALDVLTAGAPGESRPELLQADRVRRFLDDASGRYAHLVVDAPPANQYPDAQVLAGIIGTVVLVAQAQRTSREALLQARKRMELGSARVVGVVLNKRTYPIPKFVYRRV